MDILDLKALDILIFKHRILSITSIALHKNHVDRNAAHSIDKADDAVGAIYNTYLNKHLVHRYSFLDQIDELKSI